jgi:hypothetical protein
MINAGANRPPALTLWLRTGKETIKGEKQANRINIHVTDIPTQTGG